MTEPRSIETDIPARLDRLPWSTWHWRVVFALGITWLLDGLEVTVAGSLAGILKDPRALGLSDAQIGWSAAAYLIGAVGGALVFGHLTDRLGRKRLFTWTLALYLAATAATAFSWSAPTYMLFRALTGAGIGGEYAAINSAIDELIPARVRGHVDLGINATFWIGAALGAVLSLLLLDTGFFDPAFGWRLTFGLGAIIGLGVLLLRHYVPESPRWLMIRGRLDEADHIVRGIEAQVATAIGCAPDALPAADDDTLKLRVQDHTPWKDIWRSMAYEHRCRSLLGFALMVGQAFFYNAVFFTYGLVMVSFYGVRPESVGWYVLPLALGNFVGPLVLGRWFDTLGRKPMIAGTYALSGVALAVVSALFARGVLGATGHAIAFAIVFFIASSAASAAYLTVSEVFPLEIRALAIALFYAVGTLAGGVGAPALFGVLIGTGSRTWLMWGYIGAAALMVAAGFVEWMLGVKAERMSLEKIAAPLSTQA